MFRLKYSSKCIRLIPILHHYTFRSYANDARTPVDMAFNLSEGKISKSSARDVIIMHGLFGSKQNWRGFSRGLTMTINGKIYALDARNHGDSPHTPSHTYRLLAEDIKHFIHAQKLSRTAAIGHSMGGKAVMLAALLYPSLIERGVIVDISPLKIPREFNGLKAIFKAMERISIPSNLPMSQGRSLAEKQLKDAVENDDTINFILLNLRKRESGEFFWACNVPALLNNMHNIIDYDMDIRKLHPYQGPMMFICGEHSNFVDPSTWPEIQTIFPNSEIHWLDAGHLVQFEQPVQFLQLVSEFLTT